MMGSPRDSRYWISVATSPRSMAALDIAISSRIIRRAWTEPLLLLLLLLRATRTVSRMVSFMSFSFSASVGMRNMFDRRVFSCNEKKCRKPGIQMSLRRDTYVIDEHEHERMTRIPEAHRAAVAGVIRYPPRFPTPVRRVMNASVPELARELETASARSREVLLGNVPIPACEEIQAPARALVEQWMRVLDHDEHDATIDYVLAHVTYLSYVADIERDAIDDARRA